MLKFELKKFTIANTVGLKTGKIFKNNEDGVALIW